MKRKPIPQPRTRQVVSQLHKNLHRFVDDIWRYGAEPENWPLTQQEQIAFVRTVIYQARKIRNSEEFLAEAIAIATQKPE